MTLFALGLLDKFDMAKLMEMIGIYVTEKRLNDIMKSYSFKNGTTFL